jgi:hypothetical protein
MFKKKTKNINKILVRQAARWSTAAKQDQNPIISVLHANYGAGYLWALNDISDKNTIEKETGINYNVFRDKITEIQDKSVKKLIQNCPNLKKNDYLAEIAGEE